MVTLNLQTRPSILSQGKDYKQTDRKQTLKCRLQTDSHIAHDFSLIKSDISGILQFSFPVANCLSVSGLLNLTAIRMHPSTCPSVRRVVALDVTFLNAQAES